MTEKTMSEICIGCQVCCNYLTFVLVMKTEVEANQQMEYYNAHGCRTHSFSGTRFAVVVPTRCEQLTPFGCKIYYKRPNICRKYDGRKDMFLKDECQLPKLTAGEKINGK